MTDTKVQNPYTQPAVIKLSERIVAALVADSKSEGYDLEAGLFGPNFSDLVVELSGTPDEDLRNQFEAWLKYASDFRHASNPKANERTERGTYFYAHVELAWSAWKHAKKPASHKALEILNKDFLCNALNALKSESIANADRLVLIQTIRAAIPYSYSPTEEKDESFYLVSFAHPTKGFAQFWRPEEAGYTPYIEQAGLFSRETIESKPDIYNNNETVPISASALHSIFAHHKTATIDTGLTSNMLWRRAESLRSLLGDSTLPVQQQKSTNRQRN